MLVGQVAAPVEMTQTVNGNHQAILVLAAEKPFRNVDGSTEKESFQITLWKGLAEEASAILQVGDLVSVRGRLSSNRYEKEGRVNYFTNIIAEKLCYLNRI